MKRSHERIKKTELLLDVCFKYGFVACNDFACRLSQGRTFDSVTLVKFGALDDSIIAKMLLELSEKEIVISIRQDNYHATNSKIIYKSDDHYFQVTLIVDPIENEIVKHNLTNIQSDQMSKYVLFYLTNEY